MNIFYVMLAGLLMVAPCVAFRLYRAFLVKRYFYETTQDETHIVRTSDRRRIALHRYCSRTERTRRNPVILVPGFGVNRRTFDAFEGVSLAAYLAERGFDVWILEFRDHGMSAAGCGASALDFTFDDFLYRDFPAACEHIRAVTRKRKLHCAGHSLGGLVIMAYLVREGARRDIQSAILMATPVQFKLQKEVIRAIGLMNLASRLGPIRLTKLAYFILPFAGLINDNLTRAMIHVPNLSRHELRSVVFNHYNDISPQLIRQVASWVETQTVCDLSGRDLLENFHRVKINRSFLTGSHDKAAPAEALAESGEKLGLDPSDIRICADFGHGDLTASRAAVEHIYPLVFKRLCDADNNRR